MNSVTATIHVGHVLDAEGLRRLYLDEKRSPVEISRLTGISANTIMSRLRRFGIPRRKRREAIQLMWARGQRKNPPSKHPLKTVLRCRCGWAWRREHAETRERCPRCGRFVETRDRRGRGNVQAIIRWRRANPHRSRSGADSYRKTRRTVLLLVGRGILACSNCGCDRVEFLEINHKNGGGNREYLNGSRSARVYLDIAQLRRSVDDLELLCKVCNALHFLQLKHGTLPYSVRWQP